MSKTEERGKTYALHKASEKLNDYYGNAMLSVVQFDGHDIQRAFIEGYQQAEKDLELSWEDMHNIAIIEDKLIHELCLNDQTLPQTMEFYQEVLKRFKETRNERPV